MWNHLRYWPCVHFSHTKNMTKYASILFFFLLLYRAMQAIRHRDKLLAFQFAYDQTWLISLYSYWVWFTHPICLIKSTPILHTIKQADLIQSITIARSTVYDKRKAMQYRMCQSKLQQLHHEVEQLLRLHIGNIYIYILGCNMIKLQHNC